MKVLLQAEIYKGFDIEPDILVKEYDPRVEGKTFIEANEDYNGFCAENVYYSYLQEAMIIEIYTEQDAEYYIKRGFEREGDTG